MKPAPFRYHAPKTLDAALAILAEVAPQDGRVLAGGQSLAPTMAFRMARPQHLVDINQIPELERLSIDGDALSIGALVRHAAFHHPVVDGPLGRLLASVVRHIAHYPIRTRGTFCGSLAHADPASEWCLTACTLGATVIAKSVRGARAIGIDDFLQGIMTTDLAEDEIITEVRLPLLQQARLLHPADAPLPPLPPARSEVKFGFYEFSRRAGDYAMAMALAVYRIEEGVILDPRVGIGGAEDRPRRILQAENLLAGRPPSAQAFREAAAAAATAIDPIEDPQTSAEYRRELVAAVTRRALEGSVA